MKKSTYLIVNVLTRIFSDSPQNTLSDAAKFVRGLPLSRKSFAQRTQVRFRRHFPDALSATKFPGEKCGLGACYYWIDILGKEQGTFAGVVFGTNAITAYVLSGVLLVVIHTNWIAGKSMVSYFMDGHTGIGVDPYLASFLWALLYCFICFIPVYYLCKNKIFIKV